MRYQHAACRNQELREAASNLLKYAFIPLETKKHVLYTPEVFHMESENDGFQSRNLRNSRV